MRQHFYRALAFFPKQSWRDNAFGFAVQTANMNMALKVLPFVSNECKAQNFKTVAHMCLTLDHVKNGQTKEFNDEPLKTFWGDHWPHAAVGCLLKNNTIEHRHKQMFAILDMCIKHDIVDQSCLLDFPFIEEKSNLPLAYHTFNTAFQNQTAQCALENEGLSVVAHYMFKHITLDEKTIWGLMAIMVDNLNTKPSTNAYEAVLRNLGRKHVLPNRDVQYIWKHFYTHVNWADCPSELLGHLIVHLPSPWILQLLNVHPTLPQHKGFLANLKRRQETSLEVFEQIEECGGVLNPPEPPNKSPWVIRLPGKSKEFERDYEVYNEHVNNKAQNRRLSDEVSPSPVGRSRKL